MADNLMGYTLWLMLHDKTFMQENVVVAGLFPRGSVRYLAELALNHWKTNRELLDDTVVDMATEQDTQAMGRNGVDAVAVLTAYLNIDTDYEIKPTALRDARRRCREWLEKRALEVQLARASRSLEQGNPDEARAHLTSRPSIARGGTSSLHVSIEPVDLRKTKLPGGIPTGFKPLDREWDGGTHPGELGLVAGSTGTGKSMALCFMSAAAFWAGANVLYYTFELSPKQIQERISTAVLQKGLAQITQPWEDELIDAAQQQFGLNFPPAADIDIRNEPRDWPGILADLDSYQREWGKYPDVLMLDSADDVAPLVAYRDAEHRQLKEAFIMLRDYAEAKQIRIWSSAQLTRDAVEKANVSLKHIGSAYAKAQKCYYVLGLTQTDAMRNDANGPKMMLYVLKDNNFGTAHATLEAAVAFGFGKNGYPGYDIVATHGLPSTSISGGFDDDA